MEFLLNHYFTEIVLIDSKFITNTAKRVEFIELILNQLNGLLQRHNSQDVCYFWLIYDAKKTFALTLQKKNNFYLLENRFFFIFTIIDISFHIPRCDKFMS